MIAHVFWILLIAGMWLFTLWVISKEWGGCP
jgi:hypothetical protein